MTPTANLLSSQTVPDKRDVFGEVEFATTCIVPGWRLASQSRIFIYLHNNAFTDKAFPIIERFELNLLQCNTFYESSTLLPLDFQYVPLNASLDK